MEGTLGELLLDCPVALSEGLSEQAGLRVPTPGHLRSHWPGQQGGLWQVTPGLCTSVPIWEMARTESPCARLYWSPCGPRAFLSPDAPPPPPNALALLSLCLSASLLDPVPLPLRAAGFLPSLQFPSEQPSVSPPGAHLPTGALTLVSPLLWRREDAAGLPAPPALPSPAWPPPRPRPSLLHVPSMLPCWCSPGCCPGPFSFLSPWGSRLRLCFHSSNLHALPRLGWDPW